MNADAASSALRSRRRVMRRTVERELRPGDDFQFPDLGGEKLEERAFVSTYHDTSDMRLLRAGATLRYRSERGRGAWQLKLPREDARLELEVGGTASVLPAEFLALVFGLALADDLTVVATTVAGYTASRRLDHCDRGDNRAWKVAVLRAGGWAGRGLRVPSRNGLLADVVLASAYGRAYAFERAMDKLGAIRDPRSAIRGPLLALALVALVGVRSAILLAVVSGLLARSRS